MPTASRNERKKRRQKRTNSLLKRALTATEFQRRQSMLLLLTILAQKGGEILITKGTMQQVVDDLQHLGYQTEQSKTDETVVIVRMTTSKPIAVETDAAVPPPPTEAPADGGEQPTV